MSVCSNLELPTIDTILSDPSTSKWLSNALQTALNRDPVDAANDAELLNVLLCKRAEDAILLAEQLQA